MKNNTKLIWKGDFEFLTELNGHKFTLDTNEENGGHDQGPRPKGLLLSALAGCTGMDVVSILKKMQVKDFELELEVEADSNQEHPFVYTGAVLKYIFRGENLPLDKLKRAIDLSQTKYCGVSAMLTKAFPIVTQIIVNDEEIK